jgi:DNA invertase Pin-like site-specific DNA recombinase
VTLVGYARVSTSGQTLDAQIAQLEAAGCARIFQEKASGAKPDRRQLGRVLRSIKPGDVLVVTRLDRLARSTRNLLNVVDELDRKQVGFRSLGDVWADSTTAHGRLILTVLGGLAEFERELIRIRTAEGRARAVAMGVKMGRPPKLALNDCQAALARKKAGESLWVIARDYKVSVSTIARLKAA